MPTGAWCVHASPCRTARRRKSPAGAWSRGLDLPHQPEAFTAQARRISRSGKKPDANEMKAQNPERKVRTGRGSEGNIQDPCNTSHTKRQSSKDQLCILIDTSSR
ncbi:hypothetical protein VPH35_072546 [Triticum aestivum]